MGLQISPPSPSPTPSSPIQTSILQSVVQSLAQNYDGSLQQSLKKLRHYSFVITDPYLPGHPIVYASDGFLQMSGYLSEEVMGRNPNFLQGPDTDRRSVLQIRDAVREERPCQVTLLNYTKQGWPFWMFFHMAPVFSQSDGRLVHFVGAQTPLSSYSLGFGKQVLQSPEKSWLEYGNPGHGSSLCSSKHQWATGTCLDHHCNGQKKKKLKKASTVLQFVIHELTTSSNLKSSEVSHGRSLSEIPETALCSSLTLALSRIQQSFVISNSNLPGMPVVYASDMFLRLTGYRKNEVLGCNCRFLQGPDTDLDVVQQIRDCIKQEKACTVRILNYRKDKAPFWNLLHVAPVRDHRGKVAYFVGVQLDMASPAVVECQTNGTAPLMQQLGAVGAVKVAVRGLQGYGLRRVLV
uniref:Putative LOV domain-containing protein n=1 Tax=Plagiogyria japonica TaxID=32161 RepID=A0A126X2M4_9MONI|nr:putative LOV domain-containing protein [Plagiogyria japonica]